MAPEDDLASDVDALYALPLDEFTTARNTLARRLRADGRRDEAEDVAALRKPLVSAWAVNRVVRERPADVRALLDAAGAIRAGAAGADDRFRAAVDDLVRGARELLGGDGRQPSDAVLREVATTLRAAAAADPELLTAGRVTEPLEPTGFEVMAGAVPREQSAARPRRASPKPRVDRAAVEEARAALAAARDDARRLGRAADAAEREAGRLRSEADAARDRVTEAEERLAQVRGRAR
jgi:hypothetical protein